MSRRAKLEAMLNETPGDAELSYFLALEFISEGELERGLTLLTEVNRATPAYIPAYVQAGQVLVKLGREGEAKTVFETGIEHARRVGDHHAAGEMAGFIDSIC